MDDRCTPVWHALASVTFCMELEREDDGRWLAEVGDLPGAMAYGETREAAIAAVQALSLRILADRIEHGEPVPGVVAGGVLHLDFAA